VKEARDSKGRRRPLLNPHDKALAYAMTELAKGMTECGRKWLLDNCCLDILQQEKPDKKGGP